MNEQKNSQPQGDGKGMVCTCCSHYNGHCGCGCCGHGHWFGHRLLWVAVALVIAAGIFACGVRAGELRDRISNDFYSGYGMPHYYMMGGYYGGWVPQGASSTPAGK